MLTKPFEAARRVTSDLKDESKMEFPGFQRDGHVAWSRPVELKLDNAGAAFTSTGAPRVVTGMTGNQQSDGAVGCLSSIEVLVWMWRCSYISVSEGLLLPDA